MTTSLLTKGPPSGRQEEACSCRMHLLVAPRKDAALFIQRRDAGRFKGKTGHRCFGLCQNPSGRIEREKVCKRGPCGLEKSVRSLGNVQGFLEQLWSPGRPLGQSANVQGASLPRFLTHFGSWESFQISSLSSARLGTVTQRLPAEHSQDTRPQKSMQCKTTTRELE